MYNTWVVSKQSGIPLSPWCKESTRAMKRLTLKGLPYPHGQFDTQVPNNYFNYCKVIMQLQQYFNQLWALVYE